MIVMLSGRCGLVGTGAAIGGGIPGIGAAIALSAATGANCVFTLARVKSTSHHTPIPIIVSQKSPMLNRIASMIDGLEAVSTPAGAGINSEIAPRKTPVSNSRTEKTMIEIRAQFRNRNSPMLVTIPQIAGSK